MIVTALFILAALCIMLFPLLIPYLWLSYSALNGLASRQFINELKFTVGGTNVFFPDLLYAASLFLAVFGLLRLLLTGRMRRYAPLTKKVIFLIVCYFLFFVAKIVSGYLEGVPIDSLVRRFALSTQCVYLFVPLLYLKHEKSLLKLLYFAVTISIFFPIFQPFLYGSADQVSLEIGQRGTLRLGFGNANVFLMLGVFAFFVWERKLWLSALPLAGIVMLAQRSAFVSLTLCVLLLSFMKKKSIKFISLMGVTGALLIAALVVIQVTSSVPVLEKAADRISQTFEKTGSTRARMNVIPEVLSEYANRPFVGYSFHDVQTLTRIQDRDAHSFNMMHPHSFVLSSLLRTGALGTLLLFLIVGMTLAAALRLYRQQDTREQGMYLFATISFFVIFGLMNTSFTSAGYVFWLLSGITFWYLNQAHNLKYQQQRNKL